MVPVLTGADYPLTDVQIILSSVGNGLASGLSAEVLLTAISHSFDPWEIDAAISAAIHLKEILEEHHHGHPSEGNQVAG